MPGAHLDAGLTAFRHDLAGRVQHQSIDLRGRSGQTAARRVHLPVCGWIDLWRTGYDAAFRRRGKSDLPELRLQKLPVEQDPCASPLSSGWISITYNLSCANSN